MSSCDAKQRAFITARIQNLTPRGYEKVKITRPLDSWVAYAATGPARLSNLFGSIFQSATLWFALFVIGNLSVISGTELSHDEAYYWLWSRYPDWGYFDHPPLIAWLIALTTGWIDGEWGVRLGPHLVLLMVAWIVGRKVIGPQRQWAWWAGWMVFPLLSIASVLALPDSALLSSELLFIWALQRFIDNDTKWNALIIGLTAALLLYAKYHGALLIAGAVLGAPELVRRKHLWLAVAAGLLLFTPHLLWQWQHGFPTLNYHLFHAHKGAVSVYRPLIFFLQQLFAPAIFLAPWIWWRAFHVRFEDPFERALLGMSVVTIATFACLSFIKSIEGNWTVAAYLSLLVLVARAPGECWPRPAWFATLGVASAAIMIAVKVIFSVPGAEGRIPRLTELRGWKNWSHSVALATTDCMLMANTYQVASKLSFYTRRQVPSLNIGGRANQFDLWRWQYQSIGKPICWLGPARKGFSGEPWLTPNGNKLRLVKGVSIDKLLDSKTTP
jgi:4-amino-4-deoxy-L-arabinose transferase-like glycosyltransferase